MHTATHCNTLQHTARHCNTLQHTATHCNCPVSASNATTGVQRCLGCLELQVSFRTRATNYRALLRKETYQDKASYASLPPCFKCPQLMQLSSVCNTQMQQSTVNSDRDDTTHLQQTNRSQLWGVQVLLCYSPYCIHVHVASWQYFIYVYIFTCIYVYIYIHIIF